MKRPRIRRLNAAELDSYTHIPAELARTVRIVELPKLPIRYRGMTLGATVLLCGEVRSDGNSALIAHELVHVKQWHHQRPARFLGRYLGSWAKGMAKSRSWNTAYRNIPAEQEARIRAGDWAQSKGPHRPL